MKTTSFLFVIMMQCCWFSIAFSASFEELQHAAEQGDAVARNKLGTRHHRGQGVRQEYPEAGELSEKAAEQGLAAAQFNLRKIYGFAKGVPRDSATACRWWKKAAARGHLKASPFSTSCTTRAEASRRITTNRATGLKKPPPGSTLMQCLFPVFSLNTPKAYGTTSPRPKRGTTSVQTRPARGL